MADMKETRSYEFSEGENAVLSRVACELSRLGKIILAAGVLLVAYIVLSFVDPQPVLQISDARHLALSVSDYALWVAISLLVIFLSVMVIRLSGPIKLIVSTSGVDIRHVMEFMGELSRTSRLSFVLLTVICILLAVSLILMILVF